MNLRFGTKEDIEKIKEPLRGSWIAHVDHDPEFVNRPIMENSTLEEYFSVCFDGSGKSQLLIAEIDGEIAGFAKVDVREVEKFYNEQTVLYLDDLYTMEQYRRQGVAAFLLKEVENLAREKKIKWLKARAYTWNKPVQKANEAAGWKNLYSEWFKILE